MVEQQNGDKFKSDSETFSNSKRFGIREGDVYYIFPNILRKELEKNGFSYNNLNSLDFNIKYNNIHEYLNDYIINIIQKNIINMTYKYI